MAAGALLAVAAGGAIVFALNSEGGDPAPAVPAIDTATVAQVDTTALDTVQVDTPVTMVMPPESIPQPPRQDSIPPAATVPPPPAAEPVFDVAAVEKVPELRNRRDMERLVRRSFPPLMRDARASDAEVILSFIVDYEGNVEPASIQVLNAVDPAFAEAARAVAERMRFRPGEIRGERVRTSMQFPIRFQR